MTLSPPSQDHERLKVLAMLHYVVAGLVLAQSLFALIFVVIGALALVSPAAVPPEGSVLTLLATGLTFLAIGLGLLLYGLALAIAMIISGRCLSKHQHYWFSFAVACGALLFTPLGTALGIATLVVLLQNSVRQLYGMS
jgi:hypothetical protein